MEEKKRYNLGVLIGGVHTYFPKEHIKGISEAASELDVNVCFFLGTRTKDFFEDVLGSKQKNSYDYQFNTIHDYSLIGRLIPTNLPGNIMGSPRFFLQKSWMCPIVTP